MAKKVENLNAVPDSTIHWSPSMIDLCQKPLTGIPSTLLNEDASYVQNCAVLQTEMLAYYDWTPVQARLLQWHGLDALDSVLKSVLEKKHISELGLDLLLQVHDERVTDALLPYSKFPAIKAALLKQVAQWPLFILAKLISTHPTRHQATANLVVELILTHPDWLAPLQAKCDETQLKTLQRLLEPEAMPEATLEELPEILRNPYWRNRRALPKVAQLALDPLHDKMQVFSPHYSELARHRLADEATQIVEELEKKMPAFLARHNPEGCHNWSLAHKALFALGGKPDALERLLTGASASSDDFAYPPYGLHDLTCFSALFVLPKPVADKVFRYAKVRNIFEYVLSSWGDSWYSLLNHFEDRFISTIGRVAGTMQSTRQLPQFLEVESDDLALAMACLLVKNKWAKPSARVWLSRYPATAARGLLPFAFGADVTSREKAQYALRWLCANGHGESMISQANRYGTATVDALTSLLSVAPEEILPEKLPAAPKTLHLAGLPRLILKDSGHAIPTTSLPDVVMCLMLSKTDEPYAGLSTLLESITPDSFARFGQALFKWWQDNGNPPKDRWIFDAQGVLGNDETARQLYIALRQWRAALSRIRAYDAMNMLAQIGSDVALMYLHTLSQQTRFNDLKGRAADLLRGVGEQRGLSLEQLADRTVPDLGLDRNGKLNLDFGTRQFSLSVDQRLMPNIKDGDGKLLKDLPKPNSKDDPALSKEAAAQYKDLKKQLKSIASHQLQRLEAAMCAQRRWSTEEFMTLFVRHPLLQHVAQGLIWGVYNEENQLIAACRVAEDFSLSDSEDDDYQLPENCSMGIAHTLELTSHARSAFGQRLSDYHILPPFMQLTRESYLLDQKDAAKSELSEWIGRSVRIASLLGLEQRGWKRSVGEDGIIDSLSKQLTDESSMVCQFEGEWFVGTPADGKEVMQIRRIGLSNPQQKMAQLDAISYSEIQRDLHFMTWFVA